MFVYRRLMSTNKKYRHKAVFFIGMVFTQRRFEKLNAVRMSVAADGLRSANLD